MILRRNRRVTAIRITKNQTESLYTKLFVYRQTLIVRETRSNLIKPIPSRKTDVLTIDQSTLARNDTKSVLLQFIMRVNV